MLRTGYSEKLFARAVELLRAASIARARVFAASAARPFLREASGATLTE